MKNVLGVVATTALCFGTWAQGILDDKAFLCRDTIVKGEGVVEATTTDKVPAVKTYADVEVDERTCISRSDDIVAFADLEAIDRFFRYYFFVGNEVLIRTEDNDIEEYGNMALGPAAIRVAEQLEFPEDLLGSWGEVGQYTFKVDDSEHVLAHIHAPSIHTLAVFTRKPECLYTLTSHVSNRYARRWYPEFLAVESGGRIFLLIPNFQGGTGSGLHREYLKVFNLTEGRLDELASTLVFEKSIMARSSFLRSEIVVDVAAGTIVVNKETRSGTGEGPVTTKDEQEIIDLRREHISASPPKPVSQEQYQHLRETDDLLFPWASSGRPAND